MDDIFSILIWIIVIFSFLSSIFKKKTPQQPPPQQRPSPQNRVPERTTTAPPPQESGDYDILREIEAMFKMETPGQQEAPPKTTRVEEALKRGERRPVSYEEYVKSEESVPEISIPEIQRTEAEHNITLSEHQNEQMKRKPSRVDKKIEEEARKFEALLKKKKTAESAYLHQLRTKIKNPETFREYILMAEILGRPKAFRR